MPPRKVANSIIVLLQRLRDLKKTIKDAESEIKGDAGVEAQIIDHFNHARQKSMTITDHEGTRITGTLVEGSTIELDEVRLKKAIGAPTWNKVTKRVIDKTKLEDAMADGTVDPNVVAQCSNEVPRKPYVRVTENASKGLTQQVRFGKQMSEAGKSLRKRMSSR